MLSEESRAEADGGSWVEQHEEAAHQKRNWVRLTYDCNDRCIFCLDSLAHDGEMRDPEEVKAQILDGRRKGAERLILSGGEPTIHPRYVDFIRLGRLAGYARIQTVTNGRMFAYGDFLTRCLDEGLEEITFSIHGPNAKVHDALVGVKGAYEEEITGLRHALEDGRPIVNVDICVNRGNVQQLEATIAGLYAMGVREFDLLHVIPFGNAWRDGKEVLFYDLEAMRPELLAAFAWSEKPDVHIWLNRFPVKHLEGFHALIQDPYKLNDEVRGRKEEFAHWIESGEPLDCREPRRCGHCYLQHVCDTFESTLQSALAPRFDTLRVDVAWEAQQRPVYGGDPASAKRGKRRLPMAMPKYSPLEALVVEAKATTLRVVAERLADARATIARFGLPKVELVLAELDGFAPFEGLTRVDVTRADQAEVLLALDEDFEVALALRQDNEAWLRALPTPSPRLRLTQPTWERLTESAREDIDLVAFFADFDHDVPVEGVPACILSQGTRGKTERVPAARPLEFDAAVLQERPGAAPVEAFRFVRRYIEDAYFTKSLRCAACAHDASCRGLHVNHVRAHGFDAMQPVRPNGIV